jgi:predicted RNA-binding Zn ribbon-like protein
MGSEQLTAEPLPVELMNTINLDEGAVVDALDSDTGVTAWLRAAADRIGAEAGTPLDQLDAAEASAAATRLRDLRDALRRLAVDATQDPRPPVDASELTRQEAVATLNALARTWPELEWRADGSPGRTFRTAGTSVDLVVGLIAHQGVELFAGTGRERLRACLAPNCLLFFFKLQTRREWCSAACGNRARVARHYQRHHVTRDR